MYFVLIKSMIKKAVVVLDLDNTLLVSKGSSHTIGSMVFDKLIIRPFAIQLIYKLYNHFDIIIFTTGTDEYARFCVSTYFSQVEYMFAHILSRTQSELSFAMYGFPKHSSYIQSLFRSKRTLIGVDDMVDNMDANYHKVYQVKPFYGKPRDRHLRKLWRKINVDFKLNQ
jgi:NLI interacting factor-like phosphatase